MYRGVLLKHGSKDPPLRKGKKHGSKDPPLRKPLRGFPGGGPRGSGGGACDPIDRFGAGVGKFVGTIAQMFANGIPPDVAGNFLYLIGRPKNVVVITRFPESAAVGFAKPEGRALFEEADEFKQIAAGVGAFREEMKVVGHQAKGVQSKGMAGRAFEQKIEDPLGGAWYAEIGRAAVATDSDEIGLGTEVVFPRETGDSTVGRHAER